MPRSVLITGSRTATARDKFYSLMDAAHASDPITHLVLGDCPTGIDRFATEWAQSRSVPASIHKADWTTHGRAAGPIRNGLMVEDLVARSGDKIAVAFTDKPLASSRGTANCLSQAAKAGLTTKHFLL